VRWSRQLGLTRTVPAHGQARFGFHSGCSDCIRAGLHIWQRVRRRAVVPRPPQSPLRRTFPATPYGQWRITCMTLLMPATAASLQTPLHMCSTPHPHPLSPPPTPQPPTPNPLPAAPELARSPCNVLWVEEVKGAKSLREVH
jgi:hypothetical protein